MMAESIPVYCETSLEKQDLEARSPFYEKRRFGCRLNPHIPNGGNQPQLGQVASNY
jgi:hypothetical protein